jgi:creatinine amidohydrolase/Fe(II)-dependent formamide hydrolase-like protein
MAWGTPALGAYALKMRGIAEKIAEKSGAILLPQNWFGAVGFDEYTGTITFSKELVKSIMKEFYANLEQMGAKFILFLTGHFGAYQVETIREATSEYLEHSKIHIIAKAEYEDVDFSSLGTGPDHAGKYETSMAMALFPELVQMDKFQMKLTDPAEYEYRDNPWGFHSPRGDWKFQSDLRQDATPELGEKIIDRIVSHYSEVIEEEMRKII